MSSGLRSQGGLVLATAMVVSSSVIFLTLSRQKTLPLPPHKQSIRSCLSSSERKKRDKKKKKVKFAENVKETNGDGEKYRKEQRKKMIAAGDRFTKYCFLSNE
ncbi:hypothetical protein like AT1G52565 [Hibiscus trionum]|uniref:Uncharacterized protein n=1 Tax=Hibiscus trionum TaxID=183268 RepID=A0A9W7IP08_HIBTR|nr:hypothetical protein like AT1G52565 [Hibiscus trionum]